MMKNYFVFLLAMLLSVSMTAQKALINTNFLKQAPTKVVELSTKRGITSTSRSNSSTQLIYDERESLNQYDFIKIIHDKSDIGKYKYRVEVTSISGDADLSLVGNNPVQQHSRTIAESDNGASSKDILEYIAWDLTHEEIAMEIVVTAYTTTTFRVKIYRIDERLQPCNQTAINEALETLCFCEIGELYHAEYFGRPVFYIETECPGLWDAGGASVVDCEGNLIAFEGFLGLTIQRNFLNIKNKIYECPNYSKECDDERIIRGLKANMCNQCEEEELYHATYAGEPVFYLVRTCSSFPDLPYQIVYNCQGQIIASNGFWSQNLYTSHLEVHSLIHSCEKNHGGGNNNDCSWGDDFEIYQTGAKVAIDREGGNPEKWSLWSSGSPSGVVTSNKTLEFNNRRYGFQDIVFNLGNQSKNIYKVSWQMYIESNSLAYFNIQKSNNSFVTGGEYKVTFRETAARYQARWFDVELYVDLDRNKLKLILDNGRDVIEKNYHSTLGGINFAAYPNAHFYIDNICVQQVSRIPLTNQETQTTSRSRTSDLEVSTINSTPTKKIDASFNSFKVFPNPSQGMTTVQFEQDQAEDLSIEVFNQTGQLVKQLPVGTQSSINRTIDLSDLPNGMYIVKLKGATINVNQKILLQQ